MRKVLKAAAIAALVLTVAIGIPAVVFFRAMDSIFGGSASVYPTDAAMLAHWRAQRPIMDELAAMLRADSRLDRIGADFTVPGDLAAAGIDAPRAARYRALMRAAGILIASHFAGQIELVYYTQGSAPCTGPRASCSDRRRTTMSTSSTAISTRRAKAGARGICSGASKATGG